MQPLTPEDDTRAIKLFKREMEADELHLRVNAVHRLKTVVMHVGVEVTYESLVPYLRKLIIEEADEVQYALAKEMGDIALMLPFPSKFLKVLLPLCFHDETEVRNIAINSIKRISKRISSKKINSEFVPMVLFLAGSEWFLAKVSSSALF